MAYEKQTWVNGEVITDAKLNHMEDGIVNAGGFSVETETRVLVPEQNFTAQLDVDYYVAQLSNVQLNGESPIKVVFDGTEYTCDAVPDGPTVYYGDYDFVEYPFVLSAYQGTCYVNVADGNQHTISASVENKVITVSEDLKKAVIDTTGGGIFVVSLKNENTLDKTWKEIFDALKNKMIPVLIQKKTTIIVNMIWKISGPEMDLDARQYFVDFGDGEYECSSEDEYPHVHIG